MHFGLVANRIQFDFLNLFQDGLIGAVRLANSDSLERGFALLLGCLGSANLLRFLALFAQESASTSEDADLFRFRQRSTEQQRRWSTTRRLRVPDRRREIVDRLAFRH